MLNSDTGLYILKKTLHKKSLKESHHQQAFISKLRISSLERPVVSKYCVYIAFCLVTTSNLFCYGLFKIWAHQIRAVVVH